MANPLTVVLDLEPGVGLAQVRDLIDKYQPSIDRGLERAGTVHNARFVAFDASSPNLLPTNGSRGPFKISVITAYDGDFNAYIRDFVTLIAGLRPRRGCRNVGEVCVATPVQGNRRFVITVAWPDT